jgi:thymidylate synthase
MANIPVLKVEGKTLAEAWEKAVVSVWENGCLLKTEYDKESDPPSRDATMIMVVQEPQAEPRLHRAFPGSLEDLEVYRQEVVEGIHDHWINPDEGKWSYTYHQRLFAYEVAAEKINQISYCSKKLAETPHSRRAQAITWMPSVDTKNADPPCLQRIWFRLIEQDGKFFLNMNTHWRSRDAYKAAFMNIFALSELQKRLAEEIGLQRKQQIYLGRYTDISDSFHIYGAYFSEFENFLKVIKSRTFAERTWNSEFARPFFESARKKIAAEKASGIKNLT